MGQKGPVTPKVGRAVVEGDYERAVDLYLGMPGTGCREVSAFRKMWLDSKDPAACLEQAPSLRV
ncbi:MAG: hypothetical protein Ct9H90mP23_1640 [Methanobacteriota archaeon]|nr:MAG: hypothetical protein Ct9H90mP23_1640 [Euryarchaeota archaeon]